ncbi:MAG: excinuclease ABC subunit A, partial [Candidatus Omnitrophica bacterium]|nr:excinuclease ABC subunit A [Candidatus Omnitrophota bacterium]
MNSIQLRGIKVHNLKNININIPHRKFVVISGVSGSGKSSLALDTLYAEGQRRFIESLSAYARQFLERMERPSIDSVSGMLPAIIIESKNSVTNARSTVGTQTEINDYLRLFFARLGITYCRICQKPVRKNTPTDISKKIMQLSSGAQLLITFYVDMNKESKKYLCRYLTELNKQGFTRIFLNDTIISLQEVGVERLFRDQEHIEVIVDRIIIKENIQKRLIDSLEAAYTQGKGSLQIVSLLDNGKVKRRAFSQHYNCPTCNQAYQEPNPHIFSFNSPLGACPACQGFGRIITIDKKLVVPDEAKSIAEGAIAPWTTKAGQWEFQQLIAYCRKKKISITKPFRDLKSEHKEKIFKGEKDFFGVEGFFKYLEKKVYKMHVRVFLSRYRGYTTCHCCKGSRLKDDALLVKIMGKNIHELSGMTINRLWEFFTKQLCLNSYEEKIAVTVLQEIRSRIRFLREVGLGYLTLDRLARTLSGGETQRINLASALGTNLVDTLYVLDEPSIGLHPRDNGMLINILKELKKNGNTIVVIEHDKEMISRADLVIDLGPYGGEKGGTVIYAGTVNGLKRCKPSLTGKYLRGEEKIFLHK